MGYALPTSKLLRDYLFKKQGLRRVLRRPIISVEGVLLTNTLIRRVLVEDWDPPSWVGSGEDAYISKHIIAKGFKTVMSNDLYLNHHGDWDLIRSIRKRLWHSAGMRISNYGDYTIRFLLRRWAVSLLRGLYGTYVMRNPLFLVYEFLLSFYTIKGWLKWNKYLLLDRTA